MVDPIDYTAGLNNSMLTGARLGGLINMSRQQELENQKAADAQALAKQFQADWQSSFGDPQKMTALAAKYPGQMEAIKSGIGFQDEQHQQALGNAARDLRIAMATGNPQAVQQAAIKHAGALGAINSSPDDITQQFQQDPNSLAHVVDAVGLSALGAKDYYGVENQRAQNETTRRGQDITMRGQDISAATARRGQDITARGQDLSLRAAGIKAGASGGERQVQLADGRTVSVGGKLHGSGANAFYEGVDNTGNMVRVPASAIAAPSTSAASAQNYAMKKDLDAILNASSDKLGFMTGITGGNGTPSWDAEVKSRWNGGDQRQLFNATKRIQGKIQNQGIAAARDMGASGINTVAEAKMYFQGMPQVDYSSPEAMQQSMRDIQQYTDNYNQQYQVDVGNGGQRQQKAEQQTTQPKTSGYQSLWGD